MQSGRARRLVYGAQISSAFVGSGMAAVLWPTLRDSSFISSIGKIPEPDLKYLFTVFGAQIGFLLTPLIGATSILLTNIVAAFFGGPNPRVTTEAAAFQGLLLLVPGGAYGAWITLRKLLEPEPLMGALIFCGIVLCVIVAAYFHAVWRGAR